MTHGARSDGEEMRAIVPPRSRLIHQLEVCLVHEPRRLKRPTAVARREMTMGDRAQLLIDDGHELIERIPPLAQRDEKVGRIEWSLSHVYRPASSMSAMSECARTNSNMIRFPSGDVSKRCTRSPGGRFVNCRRSPLARSKSQKFWRRKPPSFTRTCLPLG